MDVMAVVLPVVIIAGAVVVTLLLRRRPGDDDPGEPVVVATRDGEWAARQIESQLDAAGLRTLVRNAASLAYYPGFPFGRWEVLVRRADLPLAREVLGEEADDFVDDASDGDATPS